MNISSDLIITHSINDSNRNYVLPIGITNANQSLVKIAINSSGVITNTTLTGSSITIPIPNNTRDYVEIA